MKPALLRTRGPGGPEPGRPDDQPQSAVGSGRRRRAERGGGCLYDRPGRAPPAAYGRARFDGAAVHLPGRPGDPLLYLAIARRAVDRCCRAVEIHRVFRHFHRARLRVSGDRSGQPVARRRRQGPCRAAGDLMPGRHPGRPVRRRRVGAGLSRRGSRLLRGARRGLRGRGPLSGDCSVFRPPRGGEPGDGRDIARRRRCAPIRGSDRFGQSGSLGGQPGADFLGRFGPGGSRLGVAGGPRDQRGARRRVRHPQIPSPEAS